MKTLKSRAKNALFVCFELQFRKTINISEISVLVFDFLQTLVQK